MNIQVGTMLQCHLYPCTPTIFASQALITGARSGHAQPGQSRGNLMIVDAFTLQRVGGWDAITYDDDKADDDSDSESSSTESDSDTNADGDEGEEEEVFELEGAVKNEQRKSPHAHKPVSPSHLHPSNADLEDLKASLSEYAQRLPDTEVSSLRWSPDGRTLAAGTMNGHIYVLRCPPTPPTAYASTTPNPPSSEFDLWAVLSGHQGGVTTMDFSSDSRFLRCNTTALELRFWQLATDLELSTPEATFSDDGSSDEEEEEEAVVVKKAFMPKSDWCAGGTVRVREIVSKAGSTFRDMTWATHTCTLQWATKGLWSPSEEFSPHCSQRYSASSVSKRTNYAGPDDKTQVESDSSRAGGGLLSQDLLAAVAMGERDVRLLPYPCPAFGWNYVLLRTPHVGRGAAGVGGDG